MKLFSKLFIYSVIFLIVLSALLLFIISRPIAKGYPVVVIERKQEMPSNEQAVHYLKDFNQIKEKFLFDQVDFLEVNFPDMEVRIYKKGVLEKQAPILARGDAESWGGTPAGLYKVIARYVSAFSIVSEVYMPYSLHFYGLYYIHGEPYYPGGRPLISDISGGCVRLSNDDAKDIYELSEKGMPILVIDKENDDYEYPEQGADNEQLELSAKAYLVADLDSGFVFAEKNSEDKLPISSLTQLMAAVAVSENTDRRKSVLITPVILEAPGLTPVLEPGKSFRFIELLYPLLIESSNDAAAALCRLIGASRTVGLMNEKAQAILMKNTNFVDFTGLDLENVSTSQDLFYLARYILNNRIPIWQISKGQKVTSFGGMSFEINDLNNKNIFAQNPDFIGGKTGSSADYQHAGLFIFRFPLNNESERRVVIILLGSEGFEDGPKNLKKDVEQVLEWLKENYF